MSQDLLDAMGEKMLERIPLNRFGDEEDMIGLAALLASEAGQNIAVDGGTTAS